MKKRIFFFIGSFIWVAVLRILALIKNSQSWSVIFIECELFRLSGRSLEFSILIDSFRIRFLLTVRIISRAVFLFSLSYIANERFFIRFHVLLSLFVGSIILLIIRPNMVSLLLGWDGLGVTSYFLVIYFQSSKSFNAGILTALSNRVGDVLILISVALSSYFLRWDFIFFAKEISWGILPQLGILMIIAGCTKRAQIPFSAWLPAAIAAPTPVSSLVHSSTLVTAGVYILIRFNPIISKLWFNVVLLFLGALTIIIAGFSAIVEIDKKKIVALSTLSQLGVIMTTLGAGIANLAFFHLLSHAFFKALLFMSVGSLIHLSRDYQDFRKSGILVKICPLSFSFSLAATLRLCGLPFTRGFYSKDLCIEMFIFNINSRVLTGLFYLATALTAAYSVRFIFIRITSSNRCLQLHWGNDRDKNILLSIRILGPAAVSGRNFISWCLGSFENSTCLSIREKLITCVIIGLGACYGLTSQKPTLRNFKGESLFKFIWGLPLTSSQVFTPPTLFWSAFLRSENDLFWTQKLALTLTYSLEKWNKLTFLTTYPIFFIIGGISLILIRLIFLYLCVEIFLFLSQNQNLPFT